LNILDELKARQAVYEGLHFVYKSGHHGSAYINPDMFLGDTPFVCSIVPEMLMPFKGQFEVMVGPQAGGAYLASVGAFYANLYGLGLNEQPVTYVWADKDGDDFAFGRASFAGKLAGKQVLAWEDLLTTGGSAAKTCRAAESHGGNMIGITGAINRGKVTAEKLLVPRLEVLANVDFQDFPEEECPHCKALRPIVINLGHGDKFKLKHPDYPGGWQIIPIAA
jgi:orotate phosphoribosyltransferase